MPLKISLKGTGLYFYFCSPTIKVNSHSAAFFPSTVATALAVPTEPLIFVISKQVSRYRREQLFDGILLC